MNKILQINPNKLKKSRLDFLEPIFDFNIIGRGVWLAGGALRTLFKNETKVDDYDLFFSDLRLVPWVKQELIKAGMELIFECPQGKLFTYKFPDKPIAQDEFEKGIKIQLICEREYLNPTDLILSFDFFACCAAFDGNHFYIHSKMVKDVKAKRLSLLNLAYPIATFKRIIKYAKKGYNTSKIAEDFVKLLIEDTIHGRVFSPEDLRIYVD